MKSVLLSFVSVVFCSVVFAADPVSDDFAFGFIVEAPGNEALYSLTVPAELYRHIYRKDMGDMRMYNARGESVPYMLRRPGYRGITKKEGTAPVSLPFFPVHETGDMGAGVTGIHVATNENGVVIDVKSADSAVTGARLSGYIIDLSMLKQRPVGLHIDWSDNSTSFSVVVDVETSVDLNRWHTMIRNAALVKIDFDGHQLSRQVIEFPATAAKYMRLSWPRQAQGAYVLSVKALFPDELSINRQVRQWVDLRGRVVQGKTFAYEYDNDAKFPVDAVNIKLSEHNSFMQAVVLSRNDEHSAWRYRAKGLFYNLNVDGASIENKPVSVNRSVAQDWRLETDSENGIGSSVPVLQLGWIPHELVFVARGAGPFTLAYGNTEVRMSEQPLGAMLTAFGKRSGKKLVKDARIKQKIVLGGETCLVPPRPPLPWKTWTLWAVLIVGVFILAVMAWRLFLQMKAASGEKD